MDNYKYIISGFLMFLVCICIKIILGVTLKIMAVQIILGIEMYFLSLLILKDEYLKFILFRIKLMIWGKK